MRWPGLITNWGDNGAVAFFKRRLKRGRVDLGTFEPPPIVEPPPVERVVEDAMLIVRTAVRMSVKNRILVDAIRENRDYDATALAELAREELATIASQNDEIAEHQLSHRNSSVYRSLAEALREASEQSDTVEAIVEEARIAAWRELGKVLRDRLATLDLRNDPGYDRERRQRMRQLVAIDLAELRRTSPAKR